MFRKFLVAHNGFSYSSCGMKSKQAMSRNGV